MVCRQCQSEELVTAVPCHFLSDAVCVDKREMGEFLSERRGYYFAHPDYHNNEEDDDSLSRGEVKYNSQDPKHISPDIFGRKQYHTDQTDSSSLTSQIIRKRLDETGRLKQEHDSLHSKPGPVSDYASNIRFYSDDDDQSDERSNNIVRGDTRPVLELAKMFLPDRLSSSHQRHHKNNRLHNIRQILRGNTNINDFDHYDDDDANHHYRNDDDANNDHYYHDYDDEVNTINYSPTSPSSVNMLQSWSDGVTEPRQPSEHDLLSLPIGVQQYEDDEEYNDDATDDDSEGDEAFREIVHILDDDL